MSEDPFACFGSDDEEDDDINEEIEQNNAKKDAILLAMKKKNDSNNNNINQRMQTPSLFSESHNTNTKKELYVNESSNLLWPNIYPPLYIGPMEIRSTNQPIQTIMKEGKTDHSITDGGGRGFFATQDLPPGTLLLVENPAFYWPENQLGKHLGMLSIHAMFHNDNMKNSLKKTQDLVQCMEELHPTKVNVDKAFGLLDNAEAGTTDEVLLQKNDQIYGMMNFLIKGYYHDNASQDKERKLVDEILETSRENNITSSNGKSLNIHDIYRMLLQLRYNGFGSGLYLNFSMFNHNDDANCIKLLPPNAVDDAADNNNKDVDSLNKTSSYSEVRTTKYVKKGQELTLHYLNTREQIVSHATRRQHFMTQHLFDIGDLEKENCNNKLYKMELVSGSIPPSNAQSPLTESSIETNRDNDDVCLRIENTLQEMEDLLNDLSLAITIERLQKQQQLQQQKQQTSSSSTPNSTDEAMKALEQSSLELIQESINQLQNRGHILLLRCYRLHLDCCDILSSSSSPSSSILTKKQEIQLHLRSLHSSQQLLKLQILYLGNFHPDVAETYNDLSQSIHILLSMDPNSLFTFDDDVFNNEDGKGNSEVSNMKEKNKQKTNFSYWSRKEAEYKKEFNRISSFYPRNTQEYIDAFRKNVLVK